jgi:hypothetical protein
MGAVKSTPFFNFSVCVRLIKPISRFIKGLLSEALAKNLGTIQAVVKKRITSMRAFLRGRTRHGMGEKN